MTGSEAVSAAIYLQNAVYRAFGAPKEVTYGNGRTLSLNYNKRLFLTYWNLPNVNEEANTPTTALGYSYQYNKYGENNTGRPDFAQSLYDATLDRAWTYDQVGRLAVAYTGVEAHADWGTATGPYAQGFGYDVYGNITARAGWGGVNAEYTANVNARNQVTSLSVPNGPTYNFNYGPETANAGYLLSDGQQSYQYDATGQQTSASGNGGLTMGYDGNGLRVQKTENGQTIYYLRSTVLGGQVVAEFNGSTWQRGYIYTGGQLLAIQDVTENRILWVHQEPYTKGQRLTNAAGQMVARLEFDPFGGAVSNNLAHTPPQGWTQNESVQRKKYTSYTRDGNGGDEAHYRRYEKNWSRFSQPDPYDGSYDLSDPQSFNRYVYVSNNPVNFIDPTGLRTCVTYTVDENTGTTDTVCFDETNPKEAVQVTSGGGWGSWSFSWLLYGGAAGGRSIQPVGTNNTSGELFGGGTPAMAPSRQDTSNPCKSIGNQSTVHGQFNAVARRIGNGARFVPAYWTPNPGTKVWNGNIVGFDPKASIGSVIRSLENDGFEEFFSFNSEHPGVNLQKTTTRGRSLHITLVPVRWNSVAVMTGPRGETGDEQAPTLDPSSPISVITIHCDNGSNYSPRHILVDMVGVRP